MKTRWLMFVIAIVAAVGCAGTGLKRQSGDVAPVREDRREEAMRKFETHRDNAQYQAALECWRMGDRLTCEAQLKSLLSRNPKYRDARQALADLAIEQGDAAGAESQLRELLKQSPNEPQTHHSLGLLLESQNRHEESLTHLRRAAELDPDSMLYQLCLPSTVSPGPSAPSNVPVVATTPR